MSGIRMDSEGFQRGFLLLLTLAISVVFLAMIGDFIMALLLAGLSAALAHPLYRRLLRWSRGRRQLAAGLTLLIALLVVLGPLATLIGIVANQAVEVSRAVRPWVEKQLANPTELQQRLEQIPYINRLAPYQDDLIAKAGEIAGNGAGLVADWTTSIGGATARFLLALFVMLYAMYYFLLDGRKVLNKILHYMPLSNDDEERMLEQFISVARATLKGTIVIGIIQGTLAGLAFAVAGIQGAVFWGTVMAVLSVVPGLGNAIVWVPAVIYLVLTGQNAAAIGLGLWCALVVGTIDNVLRPKLVGQDTKMPDLLILISTLGGLTLFGATGFVIGPIVAALFLTVWELYGTAFHDMLPPSPHYPAPVIAGAGSGTTTVAAGLDPGDGSTDPRSEKAGSTKDGAPPSKGPSSGAPLEAAGGGSGHSAKSSRHTKKSSGHSKKPDKRRSK